MKTISSYEHFDKLGRIRLSPSFYMRDFLYSEIAAWHRLPNIPDHPELAIESGQQLCMQLLEPLQTTFGRIEIRSAYRSPAVNELGNKNGLNCGSTESNYGAHIWDYLDATRKEPGAMACIVVPWFVDRMEKEHHWTEMAWWIHDHLPYSTLHFFVSGAFNIGWQQTPQRTIRSTIGPHKLTTPEMTNHTGSHANEYLEFPPLHAS